MSISDKEHNELQEAATMRTRNKQGERGADAGERLMGKTVSYIHAQMHISTYKHTQTQYIIYHKILHFNCL